MAIIPHTYEFTNFNLINIGDLVNIEFDILGKYINKILMSKIVKFREVNSENNKKYHIVFSDTPFYAESGGQVGDIGHFSHGEEDR